MFWIGFRLYRTEVDPKSKEFAESRFESIDGKVVRFYFYKDRTEDLRFKFGKLRRYQYNVYIVRAHFDDTLPDKFTRFNNLKFYVKVDSFITKNDKIIGDILAEIYINYLLDVFRKELK